MARMITIDQQALIAQRYNDSLVWAWIIDRLVELFGDEEFTSKTGIRAACQEFRHDLFGPVVALDGYLFLRHTMPVPPGNAGQPTHFLECYCGRGPVSGHHWKRINTMADVATCLHHRRSLLDRLLGRKRRAA